ncbi:hypothetical protein CKO23_10625 [Thiocystis violacea]|nr:hypothetical protein [Thiocystis violacea]
MELAHAASRAAYRGRRMMTASGSAFDALWSMASAASSGCELPWRSPAQTGSATVCANPRIAAGWRDFPEHGMLIDR